jgi:hypothetical protein
MAMPSTALSPSAMDPASAVTSPSFTTSKGMPPQAACSSKNRRRTRLSNSPAARRGRASPRAPRYGHVHARGAAADGVDARQVGGGAPQRIVDAVEVILRIGLRAGVPGHLIAEDHLAIGDGGALAVAGAQVEADAAAIQVAAERRGGSPVPRERRQTRTLSMAMGRP